MKLTRLLLATSLIIGTVSSEKVFSQTDTISTQRLSTTTVFKGTPSYIDVQRWLAQHTLLGNDNAPPSFSVAVTHSVPGAGVQTDDMPGPPVPLPEKGSNGDTITITSCGGGTQQSWTFVYNADAGSGANGWVLESYSLKMHTRSCSPGN
jgi:hypothetical protein